MNIISIALKLLFVFDGLKVDRNSSFRFIAHKLFLPVHASDSPGMLHPLAKRVKTISHQRFMFDLCGPQSNQFRVPPFPSGR